MTATAPSVTGRERAPAPLAPIAHFAEAARATTSGAQLRLIRTAAPRFRDDFRATGTPDSVATCDLVTVPYPTAYGLFRAAHTPLPYLAMTNRLVIVRWRDPDGQRRTLLWGPTDAELSANVPFYAALARKTPALIQRLLSTQHATVLEHLSAAGIAPNEVDYIAFDHLHTQDCRRLLGTRGPAPDLTSADAVTAQLPNARMIVQRRELASLAELHPLQRPWYQPDTYRDLPPESLLVIDGDVQIGPGVALLHTPGHSPGMQSLVLHTHTGIWASSENVVAAECLSPAHSRIPGVARWARASGQEIILNGNTIETTAEQYNSCVKEKLIVDPCPADPRFAQFFPTSELTAWWGNPGARPTFAHGGIFHHRDAHSAAA